ncbi:hypothetical protein A11A3_15866 [Alcanivorax hongdengensis A-11-3]|uniref:Co-chaperone DjlA N-terminal domain-containing protein n=1 Tax=Alcanivorax hongdengensis A-11-3 TaxID=1177179 RepID=L0WA89_9GAMM|nr:TerB family tellurite resistance protein [Alcanivorax hongdengensis]EKF72997.1 hypothetical protein A11A3_15866 [Alcanivorax hongdengensis A-11-3]
MNWLNRLFRPDTRNTPQTRHDVHRAAAALLLEVARTDGKVDARERQRLLAAINRHWKLDDQEMEDILGELEQRVEQATDLFEFTLPLRDSWGPEQRVTLIEEMWAMAAADGNADPYEEQLIRRVSELLHVSHGDFIRAKLQSSS